MSSCRWSLALCTALLAVSLGLHVPAAAEEQGKAEATPAEAVPVEASAAEGDRDAEEAGEEPAVRVQEAETEKLGEPGVLETELTPEEMWDLVSPWEDQGIEIHGAGSRSGESRIPTHGGGSSGQGITTHTQTSGDQERIPVTRIGESNDADIVVHGGSREGSSRIRVHGPTGD
jgi:hypothetical protein